MPNKRNNSQGPECTPAALAKRMALQFEKQADAAARSNDPWWLGNLRTNQNFASKYWGQYFKLSQPPQGGGKHDK